MSTRYPFALIKEKLACKGDQAMDFAIGRHHVPAPKDIDHWIRENVELAMRPATPVEAAEFAEAASAFLQREYGADVEPARILPAPGGRAAMGAFLACAMEPGQSVLITEPGYPAFARLAEHRHARILTVDLDPGRGFAPDVAPIEKAALPPPRVIALNYPNNPTAAVLSPGAIASLGAVCDRDTILFNDATYGPLVYEQRPTSLLNAEMSGSWTAERVELHSFAKLVPIGPIAVSFLAGTNATMRAISTYSEFAWSPLSVLQLRATTLCLRDEQRLRTLREFFPGRLDRLRQTLTEIGFVPYPAPSGVYVICPVPVAIGGQPVATAAEAAARLMDEFDLAVVPWDTSRHAYLRFTSLYRTGDLERLMDLRERLRLA